MNPRQMKQAMKRLGISTEEIKDVEEVVIRTPDKQYVIRDAAVTLMNMQGQSTFQIVGEAEIMGRSQGVEQAPAEEVVPQEDVDLVVGQTGCTEEVARATLKECNGQPAEAILKIMSS